MTLSQFIYLSVYVVKRMIDLKIHITESLRFSIRLPWIRPESHTYAYICIIVLLNSEFSHQIKIMPKSLSISSQWAYVANRKLFSQYSYVYIWNTRIVIFIFRVSNIVKQPKHVIWLMLALTRQNQANFTQLPAGHSCNIHSANIAIHIFVFPVFGVVLPLREWDRNRKLISSNLYGIVLLSKHRRSFMTTIRKCPFRQQQQQTYPLNCWTKKNNRKRN